MKKVITHGRVFHADETVAIAILKTVFGEVEAERTFKPTAESLENPEFLVLDIGRDYNPEKGNFDHHQNAELGASNLLIFANYFPEICKKFGIAESEKDEFYLLVTEKFLNYISEVDCGKILEQNTPNIPTINSIIRNLNNAENGFETALQVAESAFIGACETAKLAVKGRTLWNSFEKLSEKVKLQETKDFIPNWKELATEEDIMLLVQPNMRDGWQVVSRSTDELVLPEHEKQTFRHNSGFMCVFTEKQDAIDFALSI
jgi:uncharacterized UPF0160 family protein